MVSLFTEMASAVIDELEPEERTQVDPKVFTRILTICSNVAERRLPNPAAMPTPPAMQFINAGLIVPGDHVWREDLSFDVVEAVNQEHGEVVIVMSGSRTIVRGHQDPIRVAIDRLKARTWNEERSFMDADTVKSLYTTYGAF